MEKLTLTKKQAYAVWADLDERGPYVITGIYQEAHVAEKNKIGVGWYGGNGTVKQQEVWQDETTNQIYVLEKLGKGYFNDDEVGQKHAKLAEIKSKLSNEDIKFLFENMSYDQILKLNDK
jgi:hypothetical protein